MIIYFLTCSAAFIAFNVFKYRQKVVRKNIQIVFPDLSTADQQKIQKKFIRRFSEIIAEILKGLSMKDNEFEEKSKYEIPDALKQSLLKDQDIFLAGAHINQWEWGAIAAGQKFSHRVVGIYKPLSSHPMDELMRNMRGKLGTEMIPMNQVARDIMKKNKGKTIYLFMTDQSTPFVDKAHWVDFFGYSKIVRAHV